MEYKKSKTLWLALGLLFVLLFGLLPPPQGLSRLSMHVIGVFVGTILLWLKVASDWPSLLCVAMLLLLGVFDANTTFSTLLGNPTCAFLIFSYMLAYGLVQTDLLKRCAVWFMTRRIVRGHPWIMILMLLTACMLVGLVIIPSTMFIIFLPIVGQMLKQCKLKPGEKLGEVIILMMAFTGSIAQGMTPIGHAHPLIALSIYEESTGLGIAHSKFMLFAIPVGLISLVMMLLYFRFIVKPDVSALKQADMEQIRRELGKLSQEEKYSLAVFILVVAWWLAPSIMQTVWPAGAATLSKLGNVLPAAVGVMLMALARFDGKPLLKIKNAAESVPWPVIFMVGATMLLSNALTGEQVGISAWIGTHMNALIGSLAPLLFVLIAVVWVIAQTNFSSNAVSVTLVISIMLPIALAKSSYVNPAALTAILGSACNYAFATPLSTAVVAIACGTQWVRTEAAWKHGLVLMFIGVVVFTVVGYPLANLIFAHT